MKNVKNVAVWFEIPVKDIERAIKFYNKVFQVELQKMEMEGMKMAFFAHTQEGVSGCLVEDKDNSPSEKGTLVYLNGGEDLAPTLARVEPAGGKILSPKTSIGPYGFMATFRDSEGNRMALHSMK